MPNPLFPFSLDIGPSYDLPYSNSRHFQVASILQTGPWYCSLYNSQPRLASCIHSLSRHRVTCSLNHPAACIADYDLQLCK